jgi:hypothetical protein
MEVVGHDRVNSIPNIFGGMDFHDFIPNFVSKNRIKTLSYIKFEDILLV